MFDLPPEPVHVYAPGDPRDPRELEPDPPGVIVHRGPPLHPDDLATVHGLPCTSPSRTLIDLAEDMSVDELWQCFANARALGLLDHDAMLASRSRVEWRPSLPLVDRMIAEFFPDV